MKTKTKKQRKQAVETIHTWTCVSCQDKPTMPHAEMIQHLLEKHGLQKPLQGTKQMLMHLDGTDWYSSTYSWKIGEVELQEFWQCPRRKDDMMRWESD